MSEPRRQGEASPRSRTYRRSLGPEGAVPPPEAAHAEFPAGASDPPQGVTRREMLTLVGATLSLAGIACRRPVEPIVPFVEPPEAMIPGVPKQYATTMPSALGAHGLLVESHEGRPTKIEGNPLHPATRGASSARMQAAILDLYDPDRSRSVRRDGAEATWADFVAWWAGVHAAHVADGGAGLAVLTEPFASPTLSRLAAACRARFPHARWATWEPLGPENVLRGLALATGRPALPQLHLERAEVILALDADLLLGDPESVAHARGFAAGRNVDGASGSMNRLWVAECAYTTTGAMADHRLRLRGSQIGELLAALAGRLAAAGVPIAADAVEPPAGVEPAWLAALADDLLRHRGTSVVVAGPAQPPEVHALAAELNVALGNSGATISFRAFDDRALPDSAQLEALAAAMRDGTIRTLVMLGGNPVYDAPADLDFAGALGAVERTAHVADRFDETSRACRWHVPRAHFLEAWGDGRALDGTLSVTQPLIEPLHGARGDVEILALLESGAEGAAYDAVRATWEPILGPGAFEERWRRVLHDGLLEASGAPPVASAPRAGAPRRPAPAAAAGRDSLELVFRGSEAVHDGRHANNGWLQELPDAVTKLTWDNPALLAPATMAAFGLENGDEVRLRHGGRELELPVFAAPGQAEWSVVLTLGYGRTAAGRVGDGVGANTYALRTAPAPWIADGATLEPTGRRRPVATTQEHGTMAGRPIVREGTLEEFRRHPEFARERVEVPPLRQLIDDHAYDEGPQWGMSIDLNRCTGCNACVTACQSENNVPIVGPGQVLEGREMHWLRVDRYYVTEDGAGEAAASPQVVFQPLPCMHCENAPCEQVCPVAATVHDREGLNVMVYNRCIGTRYCSNNCPYKVRRFNFFNFTKDLPEVMRLGQNPDVTVRSRGVMEKCNYCTQRINAARIEARLAGRPMADGDARTACQQACPAEAIAFGDIRDPQSDVARRKRDPRDYALLAELNNRPRTTYLARIRNPHPALEGA